MKFSVMGAGKRSVLIAILCGMMASSYLHDQSTVDLSFGFPPGGFMEGVLTALIGGLGGFAILMGFRLMSRLGPRPDENDKD